MSTLTQLFTSIANSIREKKGTSSLISAEDFPTEITSIPTGASMNIFVQTTQPSTFQGIWINSNSFTYTNVVEIEQKSNKQASSINFLKGDLLNTQLLNSDGNLSYFFNAIILTDSNNNVLDNIDVYYGTGSAWVLAKYTELEYIQGTGKEFIDTGYIHKINTRIDIKFYADSSNTNRWVQLLGARKTNALTNCFQFYSRYNSASNFCYARDNKEVAGTGIYNTWVEASIYRLIATYTDGTTSGTINNTGSLTNGINNMLLFGINNASAGAISPDSNNNNNKLRIAWCKIYDDDGVTLVRDYIPVQDAKGNLGLYDKVEDKYYYDRGTGGFVAGPVKQN